MNDIYVLTNGMTKEQIFRLHLINGFNFAPIVVDAIVDLSKDFFQSKLEFYIVVAILETLRNPNVPDLTVLGSIVLIRTILGYFLSK